MEVFSLGITCIVGVMCLLKVTGMAFQEDDSVKKEEELRRLNEKDYGLLLRSLKLDVSYITSRLPKEHIVTQVVTILKNAEKLPRTILAHIKPNSLGMCYVTPGETIKGCFIIIKQDRVVMKKMKIGESGIHKVILKPSELGGLLAFLPND